MEEEIGTLSSTLADESPLECTSSTVNVKIPPIRQTKPRRGRARVQTKTSEGIRSRSVSKTWNKRRVTFLWTEPIKVKSGIGIEKSRNNRASARCKSNNLLRKEKLKDIRFTKSSIKSSSVDSFDDAPMAIDSNEKPVAKGSLMNSMDQSAKTVAKEQNIETKRNNNAVSKTVQILVEKITDLVKVTHEMKEKINHLKMRLFY